MQQYCTCAKPGPNIPEDDGRSLLAMDQYMYELKHLSRYSVAEERDLVQRVRQGDREAKTLLIESCLGYVCSVAACCACRHASNSDVLDVVQAGNEAIVRHVDVALKSRYTCALLRVVARRAMIKYCIEDKLIRVPETSYRRGRRAPLMVSLLTPLDDRMLLDLLEDADWQRLHEAVCDELGCEYPATSFDGEVLEFRCDEHVEVLA